jgi:hypothetical protein
VDDTIVNTQTLMLNGGASKLVQFEYIAEKEGTHTVSLGDLTGSFTVKAIEPEDPLVILSLISGKNKYTTGEPILITAFVRNAGSQPQTFNLILKVNNQEADNKVITLAGGIEKKVEFTITEDVPGNYQASLNNLSVTFKVDAAPEVIPTSQAIEKKPFNWSMVLGIAAVVVIAALIVALVASRKKKQ